MVVHEHEKTYEALGLSKKESLRWLPQKTLLLVQSGSYAYGTSTPTSDRDYKGFAVAPTSYVLGCSKNFEQAEWRSPDPDCTVYELRK